MKLHFNISKTECLSFAIFLFLIVVPSIALAQPGSRTIGNVAIVVEDVFRKGEDGLIYRVANSIKVNTREDIVRRELLFKEGDQYDPFVIAESGRNLRSLPFLRDIRIREYERGDFVDIVVLVQDTWTLFPVLAFSSGTGNENKSIGLVEGNIFGYGKRGEFLLSEDEGRRKYELVWDDRRFLNTLQRFTAAHFERSDGRRSLLSWGLPFRSLVNPSAWFVDFDSFDLIGRLFRDSEERYIFREESIRAFGGYTWSFGTPSELINRLTLGYGFSRQRFEEASAEDFSDIDLSPDDLHPAGGELAEDRRFSGPVVSYQRIKPDFVSLNYIDFFDRVQDFNLGNEFVSNFHISPEVLGSEKESLLIRVSDTDGYSFGNGAFVRGQIGVNSRLEEDEFNNTVFSALGRYYQVFKPTYFYGIYFGQHTLAVAADLRGGFDLDEDSEFRLGASNALRGYEDRTFTGSHSFSLNVEDRVHLVDDVLKLVSVGGAAFVDVGSVSQSGLGGVFTNSIYSNIGLGLRFGLLRSSGGTVVRLDLAFPLKNGPDGSGSFEPRLLITTGQLFSAFLRSDAPGLQTPSISAGFAP